MWLLLGQIDRVDGALARKKLLQQNAAAVVLNLHVCNKKTA
jgi:hypothetical protein